MESASSHPHLQERRHQDYRLTPVELRFAMEVLHGAPLRATATGRNMHLA